MMTEEQCTNIIFSLITPEKLLEAELFQDAFSTGMFFKLLVKDDKPILSQLCRSFVSHSLPLMTPGGSVEVS